MNAALCCALVVLVVAGVTVVVRATSGDSPPSGSPHKQLARIRDFVAVSRSARFTGDSRHATDMMTIEKDTFSGSFEMPGQLHFVSDFMDNRYRGETVSVEAGEYVRTVERGQDLDRSSWRFLAANTIEPREFIKTGTGWSALSIASGQLGSFGHPFDLGAFLGRLHGMRWSAPGVLEGTFPTRELLPEATVDAIVTALQAPGAPAGATVDEIIADLLPSGYLDGRIATIQLVSAPDGRLEELAIAPGTDMNGGGVGASTLRFSAWGEPVDITPPVGATTERAEDTPVS